MADPVKPSIRNFASLDEIAEQGQAFIAAVDEYRQAQYPGRVKMPYLFASLAFVEESTRSEFISLMWENGVKGLPWNDIKTNCTPAEHRQMALAQDQFIDLANAYSAEQAIHPTLSELADAHREHIVEVIGLCQSMAMESYKQSSKESSPNIRPEPINMWAQWAKTDTVALIAKAILNEPHYIQDKIIGKIPGDDGDTLRQIVEQHRVADLTDADLNEKMQAEAAVIAQYKRFLVQKFVLDAARLREKVVPEPVAPAPPPNPASTAIPGIRMGKRPAAPPPPAADPNDWIHINDANHTARFIALCDKHLKTNLIHEHFRSHDHVQYWRPSSANPAALDFKLTDNSVLTCHEKGIMAHPPADAAANPKGFTDKQIKAIVDTAQAHGWTKVNVADCTPEFYDAVSRGLQSLRPPIAVANARPASAAPAPGPTPTPTPAPAAAPPPRGYRPARPGARAGAGAT